VTVAKGEAWWHINSMILPIEKFLHSENEGLGSDGLKVRAFQGVSFFQFCDRSFRCYGVSLVSFLLV
jgi:hypothetical protein